MKRIAALAAPVLVSLIASVLALALGAAPATAMASTRGAVPGPMSVRTKCPTAVTSQPVVPPCCGPITGAGADESCWTQTEVLVVFDMPTGSSTVTEVHSQGLRVGNELLFRGRIYAVRSVRGDHFTMGLRGKLFVNRGHAIHDGVAVFLRGHPV